MIRVLIKLAAIFVLAYAAVHLVYARLEKELLTGSCCGIAEFPVAQPAKQNAPAGKDVTNPPAQQELALEKEQAPAPQQPDPPVPPVPQGTAEPQEPVDAPAPEGAAPALPSAEQPVDYEHPDFQVIVRRNIFQLVQTEQPETATQQLPKEVQPVAAVEEAPQTSLNLTLQGTIMGDDQVARAIIIEDKQTEQKLYRIGDAVQGAIIESIERGKVILEVFGARETLLMEKRKGGGPRLPSPPVRTSSPTPRRIDSREEQQVRTNRRPPSIRTPRRINIRRNPLRNARDTNDDTQLDDVVDEEDELLPEDDLPSLEEEN
ncbi:MAG: type II secretion system protein N [Candidatus Electrothrix aestuarii]|uniref:Type II secretion system protein N n=1 Tax=Candidatus Electrothrix aestuarii TaxID=3062594 RepID=A0AAU8LSR1_9BACT|nr:type II secretion system protein N [Candidatus Electrothrix aestuarii]